MPGWPAGAAQFVTDWTPDFGLVGMLNDDSNPVGAVHLGVVFAVEADGRAQKRSRALARELLSQPAAQIGILVVQVVPTEFVRHADNRLQELARADLLPADLLEAIEGALADRPVPDNPTEPALVIAVPLRTRGRTLAALFSRLVYPSEKS